MGHVEIWVLTMWVIFQSGYGFYLPGSYPHKYVVGDPLSVKVNSLTSIDTEMPFSYYSLPFCKPKEGVKDSAENLGELLMGDRIENSPYKFKMYVNESEIFLCQSKKLSADDFKLLKKRIDEMYQVNLILDNLPAIRYTKKEGFMLRWTGYPVGVKVQNVYYLFNHLKFKVLIHKYEETSVARVMGTGDAVEVMPTVTKEGSDMPGHMVVGFEVVPCSVVHDGNLVNKLKMYEKYQSPIKCDPNAVSMPIKEGEPIVFTYEVAFEESDIKWPSRWDAYLKMEGSKVHWFSILNSLLVIIFLAGIVLVIFLRTVRRDLTRYEELDKESQVQMNEELSGWKLVVGDVFRAPSNPALLCILIGDGVQILGIAAGYVAVRLWRTIGCGDHKGWISVAWKAACFFPVPLTLLGGYFGAKAHHIEYPVRTNQIPREIPAQKYPSWLLVLGAGTLPFGTLFIELFFIMSSIWMGRVYYVFGFLFIVLILLVVVCAEVSLVLTYMHLCVEDWKWWWKSFFASVMLATGTVGFLSSFWFVHYLFASVKLD
ncbi:hypothetical protein ES332_A07G045700v1 [Gossypium tomentosum]|uniref:Transmembrane 9 superfamily member n=1 Tax=Gossypium tomentosum TaxID=34277 RepID=A0A5D2PNH1_GOSTO|nr:hypothetical protein ES332_A07G045700v1 [Gossypium tomentosum]